MLYSKSLTDLLDPVKTELEISINGLSKSLHTDNVLINKVISYVFSTGGKRIRPALTLLASKLFDDKLNNSNIIVSQAIEIIHTASLVHDDVIDNADLRRGKATVKSLWDNKIAVVSGDFLLAKASYLISTINNTELVSVFAKVLEEMCNGEIQQTNLSFNTNITMDEYLLKSKRKTAMLFSAATEGAAIVSNASAKQRQALMDFGVNYGLAFQIVDDILNFYTEDQVGKPSGDDLQSGIITAPTIYALEEQPDLGSIINTRFEKTEDFETALNIIKNSYGFDKAKELAMFHVDNAIKSLDVFPKSNIKSTLIQLAEYVTQRNF